MSRNPASRALIFASAIGASFAAAGDENLFGYVRGAEPLPQGALEFHALATSRREKSAGAYSALDVTAELEYGISHELAIIGRLIGLGVDASGQTTPDEKYSLRLSGAEAALKYSFLSPALHSIGLSTYTALSYRSLDPGSGGDQEAIALEQLLSVQKYFQDGQTILAGNLGIEATHAQGRGDDPPPGSRQPPDSELALGVSAGAGLTYRLLPKWFVGIEALYAVRSRSEGNQERWSLQAGPTLHYGDAKWWATLTWLPQLEGGGERHPQQRHGLQLLEKTQHEYRLKLGVNF